MCCDGSHGFQEGSSENLLGIWRAKEQVLMPLTGGLGSLVEEWTWEEGEWTWEEGECHLGQLGCES